MMQSKLHQEEEEEEKTKVWQCDNYDKIMSGEVNKAVNRTFASTNGSAKRVVNSQKELVTEFMKILSPAFMARDSDEAAFRAFLRNPAYADRSYFIEFLKAQMETIETVRKSRKLCESSKLD